MLKYNAITVHGPERLQLIELNASVIDDEGVVWREPSHKRWAYKLVQQHDLTLLNETEGMITQ